MVPVSRLKLGCGDAGRLFCVKCGTKMGSWSRLAGGGITCGCGAATKIGCWINRNKLDYFADLAHM